MPQDLVGSRQGLGRAGAASYGTPRAERPGASPYAGDVAFGTRPHGGADGQALRARQEHALRLDTPPP